LRACERENQPTVVCERGFARCVLGAPRGRQRPERISLGYIQERQREQVRIAQLLEAIRQTAIHFPGAVATVSLLLMLTLRIRALPALYLADQTSAPHPPTDLLRPGTRRRLLLYVRLLRRHRRRNHTHRGVQTGEIFHANCVTPHLKNDSCVCDIPFSKKCVLLFISIYK
jgi:hypothetical protein